MKLPAKVFFFCFWFFASSRLWNQIESITSRNGRVWKLISILFSLKQFFFICCTRDLRSNFAYKPNETPVIQRKKKVG
jgi:hypothetical protein